MRNHNPLIGIFMVIVMIANCAFGGIFVATQSVAILVIHAVLGTLLVCLIATHLHFNGRHWFDAGKALFRGEQYKGYRLKNIVEWLMLLAWLLVVVMGILSAFHDKDGVSVLAWAPWVHRGCIWTGLGLAAIHLLQHLRPLWMYITRRYHNPNSPR